MREERGRVENLNFGFRAPKKGKTAAPLLLLLPSSSPPLPQAQLLLPMPSPALSVTLVVKFDHALGHVVESVHPPTLAPIDTGLARRVARLSLPDSSSLDLNSGDVVYTFRVRDGSRFLFGSVFFRQKKQLDVPRGAVQKSVVLLTEDKTLATSQLITVLGPLYFTFGPDVLNRALEEVMASVYPHPGKALAVAGTTVSLEPDSIGLYTVFQGLSICLWHVWELTLCAQPILVLAGTPAVCSQAVLALCSLISPLVPTQDFRPYFTIYDDDFDAYSKSCTEGPILGATNPFLLRALERFPNVLCMTSQANPAVKLLGGSSLRPLLKDGRWAKSLFLSKESALTKRDESVVAQLRYALPAAGDALLRATFREMTESFLLPMEKHAALTAIGARAAAKQRGALVVNTDSKAFLSQPFKESDLFDRTAFLASVPRYGRFPRALYSKFLDSGNFPPWLALQRKLLNEQLLEISQAIDPFCQPLASPPPPLLTPPPFAETALP